MKKESKKGSVKLSLLQTEPTGTVIKNCTATPTETIYGFCVDVFKHFNKTLFNDELSHVIITMQRGKKFMGYFAPNRWAKGDEIRHELAINPDHFVTIKPLEFFQTMVHEMVHQWQEEQGSPSKNNYHNKEWATKMESIGLMPSDTGFPGGKKIGFGMSDYPIKDGDFVRESLNFIRNHEYGFVPYLDRWSNDKKLVSYQVRNSILALERQGLDVNVLLYGLQHNESDTEADIEAIDENAGADSPDSYQSLEINVFTMPLTETLQVAVNQKNQEQIELAAKKQKVTYQCGCPDRQNKVWGSPGKKIICGNCGDDFVEL